VGSTLIVDLLLSHDRLALIRTGNSFLCLLLLLLHFFFFKNHLNQFSIKMAKKEEEGIKEEKEK